MQDSDSSLSNNSNKGLALGKLHGLGKNNTGCPALLRSRDLLAHTACVSAYRVAKQPPALACHAGATTSTQEEDKGSRRTQEHAGKDEG